MTFPAGDTPPHIPARIWMIAAITGAAAFIALLDSTVANLALVRIREDFSAPFSSVQWIATAYLIALAVSLPCAAWASKRIGYGRTWAFGLAVFVFASALCAMAPSLGWLIAARIVQGLSAGLMIPAGQAVVGRIAEPAQLGRLFGVIGLIISLGPAFGPALAGFLIEQFSWRWIFWINLPIGMLALVAARGRVPMGRHDDDRAFKPVEFLYLGGGLALLLYGATELGIGGQHALAPVAVIVGAVLLLAFGMRGKESAQPLIDLRLLKSRHFASAVAATGFAGANLYGGLLLIPIYLQLFAGLDVSQAGLLLLVMGLGTAVAMPAAGLIADRFDSGYAATAGGFLLIATTIPFLVAATLPMIALVPLLALRGAGLAWLQIPAMTSAYEFASNRQMGDATTLVNIAQRVGGAVGAAILAIAIARFGDGSNAAHEAFSLAFTMLIALSMIGTIAAVFLANAEKAEHERQ